MSQRKIGALLSYVNIFLRNGINIIYTPFLISFLGQADYGIFQMANNMIVTLSVLSLGFSTAYIKYYWTQRKKGQQYVNELNGLYILFYGFISLIVLIVGFTSVTYFTEMIFHQTFSVNQLNDAKGLLFILVLNLVVTFLGTVFQAYIIANQQFIYQQIRVLMINLLQPIITIALLMNSFGIVAIGIAQLGIGSVFLFLNAIFAVRKLKMSFSFSINNFALFKSILGFSGFILLNSLVDLVNNNVPGIIVGSKLGPEDAAIYALVIQLRNIFFQLPLAFAGVFVPKINKMVSEGASSVDLTRVMIQLGRIQLTILLFLYGGFVFLGQSFIDVWAGKEFRIVYSMLIVVIPPIMIALAQYMSIEIQRAKNMHHFRAFSLGGLALVNVTLTLFLVPIYGVKASVVGYVISLVIGNGLLLGLYNHLVVGLDMIAFVQQVSKVMLPFFAALVVVSFINKVIPSSGAGIIILEGMSYALIFCSVWWFKTANVYEKNIIKIWR